MRTRRHTLLVIEEVNSRIFGARKDSWGRVQDKPNRGVILALRKGMLRSSGEASFKVLLHPQLLSGGSTLGCDHWPLGLFGSLSKSPYAGGKTGGLVEGAGLR